MSKEKKNRRMEFGFGYRGFGNLEHQVFVTLIFTKEVYIAEKLEPIDIYIYINVDHPTYRGVFFFFLEFGRVVGICCKGSLLFSQVYIYYIQNSDISRLNLLKFQ